MFRTKCAIALATVTAAALLSATSFGAGDEKPAITLQWDDAAPIPGSFEVAQRDDDIGPPGPPRDGDDRRPPPPRAFGRRMEADGPQPPPPPRDGDDRRPMMQRAGKGDAHPVMLPGEKRVFVPRDEEMQKRDPEMHKLLKEDRDLERQTDELAMRYRRATSADREKIKERIDELVNKHFDVRQQRRALELTRLESELQRLRETMDKRVKARKELVERRVSELIGREDEVGF